ncbi:hypothetical protein [Pseudomaricurvus sp.]|uniref:hypothetical protein n=1 Tax=Pseudomaricurvus sp. TaxID=2004510 RepID=UPI003F6C0E9A
MSESTVSKSTVLKSTVSTSSTPESKGHRAKVANEQVYAFFGFLGQLVVGVGVGLVNQVAHISFCERLLL